MRGRAGNHVFAVIACAAVLNLAASALADGRASAAQAMVTGEFTSQPIGHYQFCKVNPGECAQHPVDSGPERLTPKLWKRIVSVNARINRFQNQFDRVFMAGQVRGKATFVAHCG